MQEFRPHTTPVTLTNKTDRTAAACGTRGKTQGKRKSTKHYLFHSLLSTVITEGDSNQLFLSTQIFSLLDYVGRTGRKQSSEGLE